MIFHFCKEDSKELFELDKINLSKPPKHHLFRGFSIIIEFLYLVM